MFLWKGVENIIQVAPFLVWCGCIGINMHGFCHLSYPFFTPLPCLIPLSPVFYPELLDSWREVAFLSLLYLPASRSMIAPHTRHAHPQLYCVDRVVNYLLLSRLMKSNVFFFLAAAHLTLPSYPRTLPCSFSSAFCASPSSWNSGRKLTRKIGHPLVRLSPLRHLKKKSSGASSANLSHLNQSVEDPKTS